MKLFSPLLFFSLITVLLSCNPEPKFIIPEQEMIDILVDIHMADGVLNTETFPYDKLELRPENYYKNILQKHHTNRLMFDSALEQYSQNRELYIKMYDKVIEQLRTKESYIQAQESQESTLENGDLFYYKYKADYEFGVSKKDQKYITSKTSFTGKQSYQSKKQIHVQAYSNLLSEPLEKVQFKVHCFVKFDTLPQEYPSLVFKLEKKNQIVSEQTIDLKTFVKEANTWTEINVSTNLILKTPESNVRLLTYFLNQKKTMFFLDDYELEIKQLK